MAPADNLRKRRSPQPTQEAASKRRKTTNEPKLPQRPRVRASSPMVVVKNKITFDDDEIPFSTAQTSVPSSQAVEPAAEKPKVIEDSEEEVEDSDDDAAPEAISTTQAKAQSKIEVSKVADAVRAEKQKQAERRRKAQEAREEQAAEAARLREQAAKEAEDLALAELEETAQAAEDVEDEAALEAEDTGSLPLLLPASLLETEAPIRPPTPSLSPEPASHTTQSLKIKDPAALKRIPDRKAGPVSVRVLEKQNPRLAPAKRMGGISNHRERMLKGREAQKMNMGKARRGPLGDMRRMGYLKAPSFV